MLLDNAVSDGYPQTRTPALPFPRRGLRSKERIVNALDILLGNSSSCVADNYVAALPIGGRNPERPAVRHRILGIEKKIEKHLLQPSSVALNQRQVVS